MLHSLHKNTHTYAYVYIVRIKCAGVCVRIKKNSHSPTGLSSSCPPIFTWSTPVLPPILIIPHPSLTPSSFLPSMRILTPFHPIHPKLSSTLKYRSRAHAQMAQRQTTGPLEYEEKNVPSITDSITCSKFSFSSFFFRPNSIQTCGRYKFQFN